MDQRREPRFHLDQSISVTILGNPEIRRTARVKNTSGRGLGLEIPYPVAIGCALKIEMEDAILLGEVIYCRGERGTYFVGVELEQALYGLKELGDRRDEWIPAIGGASVPIRRLPPVGGPGWIS